MAAFGNGRKADIRLSLFENADHGKIAGDPGDGLPDDTAAFIADQPGGNAPSFQLGNKFRAAVAAPFLCTGGGKIHVVLRYIPFPQQFFRSLEESHDGTFCIGSAPSPDFSVGNIAGEGRMNPFTFRRNHVLMAHQDQRTRVGFPLPEEQQVSVDFGFLQLFVDEREELLQDPVE